MNDYMNDMKEGGGGERQKAVGTISPLIRTQNEKYPF